MIKRWLSKYFATVFVLATLIGVFHQHSDLSVHEDCQICIVQSNISDGDIPQKALYLKDLEKTHQNIVSKTREFHPSQTYSSFHSRAPPKYS